MNLPLLYFSCHTDDPYQRHSRDGHENRCAYRCKHSSENQTLKLNNTQHDYPNLNEGNDARFEGYGGGRGASYRRDSGKRGGGDGRRGGWVATERIQVTCGLGYKGIVRCDLGCKGVVSCALRRKRFPGGPLDRVGNWRILEQRI